MTSVSSVSSSTASIVTTTSQTTDSTTLSESDVVDAAYERALEPATLLDTEISDNETKIAGYQDMQTLLQSLESSLSSLHDSTDTTNDAFSQRSAALTASSTSSTAEMSATVAPSTATGTHEIVIEQVAAAERIAGSDVSSKTTSLGYAGTFTIGEADGSSASVTVTSDMSLSDVEDAINNQSSTTGVTASILQVSGSQYMLVLTAQDTNQAIELASVSGTDVPQSLGLVDSSGGYVDELQAAKPAIIDVDGVSAIQRDTNTISDVIEGVTLDLTQADASTTITMRIANDTSSVETAIDSFVTAYNNWRDYVEQNQATQTDGTASSGATLFSDSILRDANSEIENALSSLVDANSLAAIGITFDNNDNLTINQTTLESALENNFTAVQSLFDFQATISDSNLILTSHSQSSYSGSFALNVTTDGSGNITGVDVGGDTSLFTVSGDLITGAAGTQYAGLTFYYSGQSSASVNVTISQGIGDQIYQIADGYANTLSGTLTNAISSMQNEDTDLQSRVDEITSAANTYRTFLVNQYGLLEARMSEASMTLALLKELVAYDTGSSS
jgi:flagellar hook-associated protein 2